MQSCPLGGTLRWSLEMPSAENPHGLLPFEAARVYVPGQPGVKLEIPARMLPQRRRDRPDPLDSEVRHEARDKAAVEVGVGSDFAHRSGFHGAFWREFYL